MQPMESARILSNRATPRHRQREKQSVQTRIVEALSEITSSCQQNTLFIRWSSSELFHRRLQLLLAHSSPQYDKVRNVRR